MTEEDKCEYLAVDFGTSNCVACAVNDDGMIDFVKLEADNVVLPTVLFVPRVDYLAEKIDESELELRFQRAKLEDRSRFQRDLSELNFILENFDGRNKPPKPTKPEKPTQKDFPNNPKNYSNALADYELKIKEYHNSSANYDYALQQFLIRRKAFEKVQRTYISPIASDDTLRKAVLVSMQRENSEIAEAKYWDQTFFSAIEEGRSFVYGSDAIRQYTEDPMAGFFIRSPKSFLAADLKSDYKEIFIKIVKKILEHIKSRAETQFRREFKGIVLGRPVNYHGVRGDKGNNDALEIMRKASHNAGFQRVFFFYEPVAAALSISKDKLQSEVSLVVDIGGGTTDCSMIRSDLSSANGFGISVSRSCGARIGGVDFDQSIAWILLMPAFGKNDKLKSGLPLPTSILFDAISTRDLPAQIRFRRARKSIEDLYGEVIDKSKADRLLKMHELQLQHKVILEAERLKILASDSDRLVARLGFVESDLYIDIDSSDFNNSIYNPIEKVIQQVKNIVLAEGQAPSLVFATGGMSQSPSLLAALSKELGPDVRVEPLDSMVAVGMGLGFVANALVGGKAEIIQSMFKLSLSE